MRKKDIQAATLVPYKLRVVWTAAFRRICRWHAVADVPALSWNTVYLWQKWISCHRNASTAKLESVFILFLGGDQSPSRSTQPENPASFADSTTECCLDADESKDRLLMYLQHFISSVLPSVMPQTMNPLHIARAPVSDPSKVMEMIHAAGTNLSALMETVTEVGHIPSAKSRTSHLKLHVDPEIEQRAWSEPEPVSAQQVQQLVQHVRQRQRELDQREADLQADVFRFEQQSNSNQVQLRKRNAELEQHIGQVKLQQSQLIKLQQNMIETQTALRKVIERIVNSTEPGQIKQELQRLKSELSENVDAILSRWERIKPQLD